MGVWELYKNQPSFVLGFHGCDKAVAEKVISHGDKLLPSDKPYDWLGGGVYFWEGSPHRAQEWAEGMARRPSSNPNRVREPAVIGAVIDLGLCCNLFDSDSLDEVADAWRFFRSSRRRGGLPIPKNEGKAPDMLKRYRDRAVIEQMHTLRRLMNVPGYDTVRGPFPEGRKLYPGAGLTRRAHIQIAVRNVECIKACFYPIKQGA